MSKVEVLCPNGHRVNIKTTPNTKILQILEEVCSKQGFKPAEEYELRHGRKTLDLALSIQFAGIPNLAKLELVKASKVRAEAVITIALQTVDGDRLMRDFLPSTSLHELLESFEQDDGRGGMAKLLHCKQHNVHPVCLYLKDEIIGEYALRETTLRQLGLTGGRAIIRHIFREVSSADIQNINAKISAEKSRREKLAAQAAAAKQADSSPREASSSSVQPARSESPAAAAAASSIPQLNEDESRQNEFECMSTSPVIQPRDFLPSNAFTAPAHSITDNWQMQAHSRGITDGWQIQAPPQLHNQQSFIDFKFPEETKGKNVYKNDLSEFVKEEHQACERETVIYCINRQESSSAMQVDDPTDDFFNVTEADVRVMYKDLQKRLTEDTDQPLMTESMRLAAMESRFGQYKHAIIRFLFPDGMVIQGVFRPREKVFALIKFVKEHLFEKEMTFELYTTPPKTILKDHTATLIEASLVPLTNVYIGVPNKCDQYLSDEAVCRLSDKDAADTIVVRIMKSPGASNKSSSAGSSGGTGGGSRGHGNTGSGSSAGSADKVPKWFKTGK